MSSPQPGRPSRPEPSRPAQPLDPGAERPERGYEDVMWGRVLRKRERIRAEIQRNRAGGHKIPTWVFAAVLGLVLLGWLYLIATR
jgi:hypothetical protein